MTNIQCLPYNPINKYKVCNDCWFTITKKGFGNDDVDEYKPLCPLCRRLNDWSK